MCEFDSIYSQYKDKWKSIGLLKDVKSYKPNKIGVYRAKLNDELVYIGEAIEKSSGSSRAYCWGLYKRLNDYIRKDDSSRKTGAGPDMFLHRNELKIETIELDYSEENVQLALLLERLFIFSLKPQWNTK